MIMMSKEYPQSKRIAVIVDDFPSPGRPSFVFVEQLVIALVNQGMNISVIAPQSLTHALVRREKLLPRKTRRTIESGKGFDILRPYSVTFGGHIKPLKLFSLFNENGISRCLKKIDPSILYCHFWHSAFKIREYSKRKQIPVFVACGEGDNAMEALAANLSINEKKDLAQMVKGVISVSSENKRKCIEYGFAKESDIIVLPNCVDDTIFRPHQDQSYREQLGIKPDDFVIAYTGAFIKRKGTRILSDAIAKLNDPCIKLIFIGKPLKGEDYSPSCPGIVYKSSTEHDLIPNLLNAADLFVLPTLKEGCCNAIVEALACGLPVVSSDRSFNYDILNGENSILVNPEDVDEVANAILTMKNDKELYNRKRKYAIDHSNQFSITERSRRIMEFIDKQLQKL